MKKNTVKQALAEGKLQLGTGFGQLRSPEISRILASAGFKWAFLDTEHGGFDLETIQDICSLSVLVGLSPIVPGERQHPRMVQAREAIRGTCVRRGNAPGTQTRSVALARFWKERGMTFRGCNNDTGMLFERASELVSQISAA